MSRPITAKATAKSIAKAKKLTWLPKEVQKELIEYIELGLYMRLGSLLWPMALDQDKEVKKAFKAIMACFNKAQQKALG